MARLVLHIGTHKTGTTMVQNRLHAMRGMLAKAGVIYPNLGGHTGHHGYLTDWIALSHAYRTGRGGRAGLEKLADRWRETEITLILSSEEFSRAGGRGGHVDFVDLRRIFHGYDLHVLCVLRPQWQFLQSAYLEIAQNSPPPAPSVIVQDAVQTGQVDGLWCDYLSLYDWLCREFDPAEIRLIDYLSACQSPEGLFGAVLGYVSPGLDPPTVESRDNRSPPSLPVWAAHVVAGGPSPSTAMRQAAQEAYDLEFGPARPGCIFTRRELDDLATRFEARNDRLANRVRQVQPGWHLSMAKPAETTLYRDDIRAEYWIRLARRLAMKGARDAA